MDISLLKNPPAALADTKQAGFYAYDQEEPKQYAFFWTNDQGKPLLISKFYQTARGRNRTLNKVQKAQYDLQAGQSEAKKLIITVLNKNQQAVAVSIPFKNAQERDNSLQQMRASLGSPSNAAPPKVTQPNLAAVVPGQPTRHSFRLVFYRSNEDKNWQGILSHPLSDDRVNFSGLDTDKITAFMQRHLAKTVTEPDTRQVDSPEGLHISWPKVQSIASGQALTVDWSASHLGQGIQYEASITAKALAGGTQTLIGRRQFAGEAAPQSFSLEAMTIGLAPGMYRLTARLDSVQPENNQTLVKESHLLFLA
jgi:hypothetical protein